jgi:hypothetical protein
MIENDLNQMRKRRKLIENIQGNLAEEMEKLLDQAEASSGTKMAQLITKSNAIRRKVKEKKVELTTLDGSIAEKVVELKKL